MVRMNRPVLMATAMLAMALAAPGARAACTVTRLAELPVTMHGLRASVPVRINGKDTDFWLDSGALFSIMSKARATELGLPIKPAPEGLYGIGVGGSHSLEVATVEEFGIVGVALKRVAFLVGGDDTGNARIGRNILAMADTEFDLAHGAVRLFETKDCAKASLAYWAQGTPWFMATAHETERNTDFMVEVAINGKSAVAEIESGTPYSFISESAARRAGIDLSGPDAVPINVVGSDKWLKRGWSVPIKTMEVGEEKVLNTRINVFEGKLTQYNADMVIGADFLLAHRLYYARSQNRVYFSYTGGKPFDSSAALSAATIAKANMPFALPPGAMRVEATDSAPEPKTAAEFARRAAARMAAGKPDLALADYDAAIALTPNDAALFRGRSKVWARKNDPKKSRADFDTAIRLAPNDPELVRARAVMRFSEGDHAGALADVDAAAKLTHPASLDGEVIGDLYVDLGQAARALPLLDAMIAAHQADSSLSELYNSRCWTRALANFALVDALADCNRALKGLPGNANILDSRALVQYRLKNYPAALADYDAALAKMSDAKWSRYMHGMTLIALGKVEAGKAERDTALASDKDVATRAKYYGLAE